MKSTDNKMELLQKLNARVKDLRGNENERLVAEKQLNILMKKYGITEEGLGKTEVKHRDFYFKEEWERKLIVQVLYTIKGKDLNVRQYANKRNWIFTDLTDTEYIEFETLYPAYKASFQKELNIFYLAFVNKNHIFPPDSIVDTDDNSSDKYSRADRMRAAMMAEGIEFTKTRRQIGNGKN